MIALRMKRGRKRAIASGKIIGGGSSRAGWELASGWRRGDGDAPTPVPGEIEHVREAVRMKTEDGASLRKIAAYLHDASGRKWSPTQVQRLLDRVNVRSWPTEVTP